MINHSSGDDFIVWLHDFLSLAEWREAHSGGDCYIIVTGRIIHRATCDTWDKLLVIENQAFDRYFAQDRIVWEKELRGETVAPDEYAKQGPRLAPYPLIGVVGRAHIPKEVLADMPLCSRCNP